MPPVTCSFRNPISLPTENYSTAFVLSHSILTLNTEPTGTKDPMQSTVKVKTCTNLPEQDLVNGTSNLFFNSNMSSAVAKMVAKCCRSHIFAFKWGYLSM